MSSEILDTDAAPPQRVSCCQDPRGQSGLGGRRREGRRAGSRRAGWREDRREGRREGRRAGRRAGSSASLGSRSSHNSSFLAGRSSLASSFPGSGPSLARRTRSAETGRAVFTGNMTGAISSTQGLSRRV